MVSGPVFLYVYSSVLVSKIRLPKPMSTFQNSSSVTVLIKRKTPRKTYVTPLPYLPLNLCLLDLRHSGNLQITSPVTYLLLPPLPSTGNKKSHLFEVEPDSSTPSFLLVLSL